MLEIRKCRDDINYFAEKYFTIVHVDHGKMLIDLYDYQKDLLNQFEENRFNIVAQSRQSGKSTTLTVFILHYILFHSDKTVALLANKGDTSQELLERIKLAFELLPAWLKPNVVEWNKRTVEFENGCSIIARATSSSSIRGLSISLVAIDEAAFVDDWESFYRSTYPTISSGKETRVILISTMKGMNHFHMMREEARAKKSSYRLFEVSWQDVPGRDAAWRDETIANTSRESFDQEHCNIALGSSNTLIPASVLMTCPVIDPIRTVEAVKYYKLPDLSHTYVITVDTARGVGLDYSVAVVWDVSSYPIEQVAVYRDNEISPLIYPNLIYNLALQYNHAHILVEANDLGATVASTLNDDLEYEFLISDNSRDRRKYQLGVMTTKKTKRIGCAVLRNLLESNKLIIQDKDTLFELANFVAVSGSYAADKSFHDDCVMCAVMLSWFSTTEDFAEIMGQGVKSALYTDRLKELDQNFSPSMVITDGTSDEPEFFVEDGEVWERKSDEDFFARNDTDRESVFY